MYAFDLRTLYTSFVVMLVVCLAVVALLWWQNRKRFRGLELIVLYIVMQFFWFGFDCTTRQDTRFPFDHYG